MGRYPLLATLHVWVTLPLCLGLAGLGRRWETALIASAYLCGSEVLWRATGASFFWEGAKYAIGLVALITLLRRRNRSASLWPVVYFALLIPGVVLTVMRTDLFASRGLISANLSGPFALTLLVLAFGHREIAPESFMRVLIAMAAPILAMGMVATVGTIHLDAGDFGSGSSFAASGGFGPNQVSAALAGGALAMFLYAVLLPRNPVAASLGLALVTYFLGQSAVTFSRTGLYLGIASLGVICLALLRSPRHRLMTLFFGVLGSVLVALALATLNDFTGGKLGERFADLRPTGRDTIASTDLQIGVANLPLGAGVGLAPTERKRRFADGHYCHTEYTRLFAEHGLLGIAALACIGFSLIRRLRASSNPLNTAVSLGFLLFSALFMAGSAFRLSLPALTFCLALVAIEPKGRNQLGRHFLRQPGMPQTSRAGATQVDRKPTQ
jgi:hypothetical protein